MDGFFWLVSRKRRGGFVSGSEKEGLDEPQKTSITIKTSKGGTGVFEFKESFRFHEFHLSLFATYNELDYSIRICYTTTVGI